MESRDPKDAEQHLSLSVEGSVATEELRVDISKIVLDSRFARLELSGSGALNRDQGPRVGFKGRSRRNRTRSTHGLPRMWNPMPMF